MAACIVLGAILLGCTLIASTQVVALVLAPVVVGLLVIELDRSGGAIATRLVRLASLLLPRSAREDHASEWVDHVLSAGEEGLRPVLAALDIAVVTAPKVALHLRFRPAAGRYVMALFLVAVEVVRADPDERRRGSVISMAKASVRLLALCATPILAVAIMRRPWLTVPRWLFYATGAALAWGLGWATNGMPSWEVLLLIFGVQGALLIAGVLVVLKHDTVIAFASRLVGPRDE